MERVSFYGRRAVRVETETLRLTVTEEGGHVAELLHKQLSINPLWIPKWRSLEPSQYSAEAHPEYGQGIESQLVAGLMGHSICLDLFGAPDPEEAAAGIPVHGEASIASYNSEGIAREIHQSVDLPRAEMRFERTMRLAGNDVVCFEETVRNNSCTDRPIGWTQHVTFGAPFLELGTTRFLMPATRAKVYEDDFNQGLGMHLPAAEFEWPSCPRKDGGTEDLSTFSSETPSGGFTAHLMDTSREHAFFLAWSPRYKLACGYIWKRTEFPWLSRWEENHQRPWAPWNAEGFALGMEFGVSPMVESRRKMVERGKMFATPTSRWIPARSTRSVQYCAFLRRAVTLPVEVRWDGHDKIELV